MWCLSLWFKGTQKAHSKSLDWEAADGYLEDVCSGKVHALFTISATLLVIVIYFDAAFCKQCLLSLLLLYKISYWKINYSAITETPLLL